MKNKIIYNHPIFKERRKELRKTGTSAENTLWKFIRNKKLGGVKFFRQYSIGPYVLDFYCPEVRVAIELDGGYHIKNEQKEYDKERTWFLRDKDIFVLRFWNNDILNNLELVLEKIKSKVEPPS